ncbi:MAG: translocation/assembly module TamB [Mediterranea sp.]|nr:translocation/assembly module TamB [Mediterranea sp.]
MKDRIQKETNLDLRINSLLIRRGKLAYDVLSEDETPGKFNPSHIKLFNIIGNISLKALSNDSINAQIKRLSVDEQSGLEMEKLSMKLLGNERQMSIENFEVDLPGTSLRMDTIRMHYDSLESFNKFITDVRFSFKMLPSSVTLQDISPFVPALAHFKEKVDMELEANGIINQLNVPRLIVGAGEHLRIRGDVAFRDLSEPSDAFIYGNLSHLSIDKEGVDFISRNLSDKYKETPSVLKKLGDISFRGEISGYFTDLVTYGIFRTELGALNVDVKLTSDKSRGLFSYSGRLKTDGFEFGQWLSFDKWGKTSFNLDVTSDFYENQKYPTVVMKGLVSSLEYSDYAYRNITLDGEYRSGGFNGKIALDDTNGSVLLNGHFNLSEQTPTFNFLAGIKDVRPHELNLTSKHEDSALSLALRANFTGRSIDDMIGTIDVDSLKFDAPERSYHADNIRISATREYGKNKLTFRSEFLNADIEGNYSYRTLPQSIINMVRNYLPSLFVSEKAVTATTNNLSFDVHIYNSEILSAVFNIPLNIYSHSTCKGYLNEQTNRMRVEGYFPRFSYGGVFVESGMALLENPSDQLRGHIRFSNYGKQGAVNVALDARAGNDILTTLLNWGNSATTTYSGQVSAETNFSRSEDEGNSLKTMINIKPTRVILNDTIWKIHPAQIVADSEKIHIDNFYFGHTDQYLRVNGYASRHSADTVKVDLKEINIGYVFDVVNLKSIGFKGSASGVAYASGLLKAPVMNARLFVRDFSLNDGVFGDMNVYGEWNQKEEGIYVDADVREKDMASIDVKGYIYPLRPKSGLDLHIKPRNANIRFLEFYVRSIMSDIKGRTSGRIHLYGPFNALNIEGSARADARFKVNTLNTCFILEDSVHFMPERISVQNALISDLEGHSGKVTGQIRHKHFKDMAYRLEMNASNMLVMNTMENPEMPFYGKVYASGSAILSGSDQGLRVDAALTTDKNTSFVYAMASAASAANSQFIKVVDKTPNVNLQDSIQMISAFELARKHQEEEDDPELDVHLNIQVDVTPDATAKIIMDPASDDNISVRGYGSIRTEFYNKGDVKVFGHYDIAQGAYKFSLQEVIRKDFLIKEGGSVQFSGDPYDAIMDIQAVYTVNSVSLSDLVPEDVLSDRTVNRNMKVNCLMNLSGSLFRPVVKLDIDLPGVSSETENLVRNYIRTDEDINMQMLYLLAIGKFYTPDYVASTTQNSNMMTSLLSSTLSGQLNRLLSQIIDNNNWMLGTNLSTGEKGWTDFELEGMLSGQLLNNRLLINGNFGYKENPLANSNFIGDFEAEWLLTRAGDIRLKAYSETNDRHYARSNLTTQGIGIIYSKDFDTWRRLLFRRRSGMAPTSNPVDSVMNDSISIEHK